MHQLFIHVLLRLSILLYTKDKHPVGSVFVHLEQPRILLKLCLRCYLAGRYVG